MNRLFIEGIEVTEDVVDFTKFEFEVGLNTSTKSYNKTLSQTLRFTGDTYEMLKAKFFSGCNGINESLVGVYKTDICGGISIGLTVVAEGMVIYPETEEIEMLLKSDDKNDQIHAKLDSSYWFDNDFVNAYEIPVVWYADQPNYISYVVLLITGAIRIFVAAVEKFIDGVCEVITLTTGKCESKLAEKIFGDLDNWLTGLGRWCTAPLIREILSFQCNAAGASFASSIFQDLSSPHYNTSFFNAGTGERGSFDKINRTEKQNVLLKNAANWTVLELLENLKNAFPGTDYRIIDGTVYFEKETFFDELVNIELFHTKDKCTDDPIGYEYNYDENGAYGRFELIQDGFDQEGNKAFGYYKQRLDFNLPYSPSQKGVISRSASFGPSRFMFDPISYEKTRFFDWERNVDEFRDGPDSFIGLIFQNYGIIRKYDLILSSDTLTLPKLLVLENNFNRNDALVIKRAYKRLNGKQYWLYNYPMMYKETLDQVVNNQFVEGVRGLMTTDYAVHLDPRTKKDRLKTEKVEFECDCNTILNANKNFQKIYIQTPYGKGIPGNVTISIENDKVNIGLFDIRILYN